MAGRVRDDDAYSMVDETGQHACYGIHGKHDNVLLSHKDGIQPRKTDRSQGHTDRIGVAVVKRGCYEKSFSASTSQHEFPNEVCSPFVGTHSQDRSLGVGKPAALLSNDGHWGCQNDGLAVRDPRGDGARGSANKVLCHVLYQGAVGTCDHEEV